SRAQPLRFEVAGWIEHFLHPRSALGALIADHDHVAFAHLPGEDRGDRIVLALDHLGRAAELEDLLVHPGGLHDTAIEGDVAVEHRQSAILAEGVLSTADHPVPAVGVEFVPAAALAE